jgi:hypothetical protein
VRFLDPVDHGGALTVGFAGRRPVSPQALFSVLDADITLAPAGEHRTHLAFAGSYRAPLGRLGAGLDKAILHRTATATIRALLADVAATLTSPATMAGATCEGG